MGRAPEQAARHRESGPPVRPLTPTLSPLAQGEGDSFVSIIPVDHDPNLASHLHRRLDQQFIVRWISSRQEAAASGGFAHAASRVMGARSTWVT
jgi:hypothetical protein